jgi:hypothetical protein
MYIWEMLLQLWSLIWTAGQGSVAGDLYDVALAMIGAAYNPLSGVVNLNTLAALLGLDDEIRICSASSAADLMLRSLADWLAYASNGIDLHLSDLYDMCSPDA